jgi:cholest-4-en-3-one 26-monooxygenase
MPVVGNEVIDPLYYERYGYPHASWAFLRQHHPVSRFEPPGQKPFWAITRYADVSAVSREPKRWKIAPRARCRRRSRTSASWSRPGVWRRARTWHPRSPAPR